MPTTQTQIDNFGHAFLFVLVTLLSIFFGWIIINKKNNNYTGDTRKAYLD